MPLQPTETVFMRGNIDNRIDRIRHETHAGGASDGSEQAIIRLSPHSSEVTLIVTDITLPLSPERLALLTVADLEYADRFSNAGRRAANLTWRAALRSAIREGIVPSSIPQAATGSSAPAIRSENLSQYKPEAYAGYEIEYSPCGAPFIAGNPFRFGVSHTSDKSALIIADTPCAIDIERADRDFSRAAARILTDKERELTTECNEPNALGLMWCAKETIYKLSGSNGGGSGSNGSTTNSNTSDSGGGINGGSGSGIDFRRDIIINRIDASARTIDGRLAVDGRPRMIRLHYLDSAEYFIVFAADNI